MASTLIKTDIEFHDAANIFPLDEEHIADLAVDIQKNGQQVPIELIDGRIVDGRRRYLACRHAEVEPIFRTVSPADPVSYVLSINLHRRHLTAAQRSMVASRAREMYDEQAKERQRESARRNQPQAKSLKVENVPPSEKAKARDRAGAAVGVSGRLVDHATKVLKKGVPELVKAVDEGRISVSAAAALASKPAEVQREELTKPKRSAEHESRRQAERSPVTKQRKGVALGNEAINALRLIRRDDELRDRGFEIVADFLAANWGNADGSDPVQTFTTLAAALYTEATRRRTTVKTYQKINSIAKQLLDLKPAFYKLSRKAAGDVSS